MGIRRVEVVEDKGEWRKLFEKEAVKLHDIFGELIVDVKHIGSTAIPGIKAKPVIDILLIVNDIEKVDDYNKAMVELGYEPKGEFGLPGRRFFMKGGNDRTHHIHCYQEGDPEVTRHLAFRDYMRSHPEEARKYSCLKEELAKKYPEDIECYIEGKNDYIKHVEKLALEWYK